MLFTEHIGKLIQFAYSVGIYLTFGEAYRTVDQQYLYFKGKKIGKGGELIDAPKRSWTMNSKHLNRLAVDFNFFIPTADGNLELTYDYNKVKVLGDYWESLDELNQWGGSWLKSNGNPGRDVPHFQRTV